MLKYEILTIQKSIGDQIISIHPVIIYTEKELILFDTGFPDQMADIEKALLDHNFGLQDITKIVISHHDHDHIGSLKALRDNINNVEIISSQVEAPYINGDETSLRIMQAEKYNKTLTGAELNFGIQFLNYLKTVETCEIDKFVKDEDYIINGLKVISTPGHTPGHISLFLEEESVILAGDTLVVENGKMEIANPKFTLDMLLCKKSIKKLQQLHPSKVICYHGGVAETNLDKLFTDILSE